MNNRQAIDDRHVLRVLIDENVLMFPTKHTLGLPLRDIKALEG